MEVFLGPLYSLWSLFEYNLDGTPSCHKALWG